MSNETSKPIDFESYKKMFYESFAKVKPEDFIKQMEALGYKFESIEPTEARELPTNDEIIQRAENGSKLHGFPERAEISKNAYKWGALYVRDIASPIIASQQSEITRMKAELEEVKEMWENQRITIQFYQDDLKAIRDIINS